MKKELYLIYVHELGKNYESKYFYEFIFSDTLEGVDGENWDAYPASGHPEPPGEQLIKEIGRINGEVRLELAMNDEKLSMWDAMDKVLALGYECIEQEYPEPRLVFHFGDTKKEVTDKLYARDIIIEYEKQKHNEKKGH